jgi:beta-glucosidase
MPQCHVQIANLCIPGIDRPNLRDDFSDGIVKNVADRCRNTVVVVHNAGIRLVDQWIDHPNVTALLFGHLPGQDSGAALVDILFGRPSPSGKLPYTVARNESDYGATLMPVLESNSSIYRYYPQDDFSEGVFIDYRAFDHMNITPRYEFGFGMTYTTFGYTNLQIQRTTQERLPIFPSGNIIPGGREDLWDIVATVSVDVTNTGDFTTAEIAQLYVRIPDDAQPIRQLRGFDKRTICVGETVKMEFELRRRDLSVWNVEVAEWQLLDKPYELFVGASSRDLRIRGDLAVC